MPRFIAHVTDIFATVHRVVVDQADRELAVTDALASVPFGVFVGIRPEDPAPVEILALPLQ